MPVVLSSYPRHVGTSLMLSTLNTVRPDRGCAGDKDRSVSLHHTCGLCYHAASHPPTDPTRAPQHTRIYTHMPRSDSSRVPRHAVADTWYPAQAWVPHTLPCLLLLLLPLSLAYDQQMSQGSLFLRSPGQVSCIRAISTVPLGTVAGWTHKPKHRECSSRIMKFWYPTSIYHQSGC